MHEIVPYQSPDPVDGAARWVHLPADERRRRAVLACQHRDLDSLWSLTQAHLTLSGRAGAHVSPHTLRAYRGAVAILLAHWQGESLVSPDRNAGALWVRSLERMGWSVATVRVRLAGARALYRALYWAGATAADPFPQRGVRPAPDPTPRHEKRQPYSDADVERLLRAARPQERALVLLGAHAGLRVSEALSLTWDDVDHTLGVIVIRCGKGRKTRRVTIGPTLCAALRVLPHYVGRPVLDYGSACQARRVLRRLCARAQVRYRGIHALRHAAGTRLFRETADIKRVAQHLGHASVATSEIYVHFADDALRDSVGSW